MFFSVKNRLAPPQNIARNHPYPLKRVQPYIASSASDQIAWTIVMAVAAADGYTDQQ